MMRFAREGKCDGRALSGSAAPSDSANASSHKRAESATAPKPLAARCKRARRENDGIKADVSKDIESLNTGVALRDSRLKTCIPCYRPFELSLTPGDSSD